MPDPDLSAYLDKRVILVLQGEKRVEGILKGYDMFMNLVLESAVELKASGVTSMGTAVVRGESVQSVSERSERGEAGEAGEQGAGAP